VQGSASGDLLFSLSRTDRDVGVLELDEPKPSLRELSADLGASNAEPAWIDDDRLAFVSDRFGEWAVMSDRRAGGQARPDARFEGRAGACAMAGAALVCTLVDASGERSLWRAEGERPAQRIGSATGVQAIECVGSTCIAVVEPREGPMEIHMLDPERGTLARKLVCPKDLQCYGERVALAPDAKSFLAIDPVNVHRFAVATGAEIDPRVASAGEGMALQSAIELAGGDIVTTEAPIEAAPGAPFHIVRHHGGTATKIWAEASPWVVRPRASPNGKYLALTTMNFHIEAALARDPCGVQTQ
jgi:hypothetical protein